MHGKLNSTKSTLSDMSACRVTIVDDCSFGRIGLQRALLEYNNSLQMDIRVLSTSAGQIASIYNTRKIDSRILSRRNHSLIIRLSKSPLDALATLLLMGRMSLEIYTNIVVLSHIEPELLKRILLGAGLNRTVKILDDRLQMSVLCQAIIEPDQIGCNLQENYFGTVFQTSYIFSPGEIRALWYLTKEVPMYKQVMRSGVSSKTLYNQRHTALIKLGVRDVNNLISRLLVRRTFPLHDKRL